jgi:hypothetical protein
MSATLRSQPHTRLALMPYVIAILIALSIGAAGGSLATRAVTDHPHPVAASGWDVQKLQAMQGRQLAADVGTGIHPWDPQKVAAMAGRQRAEVVRRSSGAR